MIPEINSENCHQDLSDIINFSNDFNVPKITLINIYENAKKMISEALA